MTGPAPKLLPLRIRLPYTGEEEFIERYGSNVGRGGVFVATRALKPEGTGLAFEFVLADGTRLLRGEGVVLKAQPDAGIARTGMTVRFTKLDAASKALIDRIVARRSGMEAAPPGLVRRTPAVNPARPAAGSEAPAPVEPPAKMVLDEPGTRAAPLKASMTLPAVKLPVAEPPPDLAEPDEPVSLFPEHAVDEEEELAPLPSVDFPRKPRRHPVGLEPQRATQEMFTVQPTTPASRGVQAGERTPATSGTFAAVRPPEPPAASQQVEASEAETNAPAEASPWEAPASTENLPAASFADAETSAWNSTPSTADASAAPEADDGREEAQSAVADGDASAPDAREDEALPPETEESGAPDVGEASAHHFTPASVDAFDPNAVLGAAHAPEHSGWSSEYATEETGDTASALADTSGEAEATAVSGEAQADSGSSFDFDVDLSMESEEPPASSEPESSFAPDAHATESAEDSTTPPAESSWAPSEEASDAVTAQEQIHPEASSEWPDPDSDTEGASFAATVPSEEDDARTVSASDAEGVDTEAVLPPAEHFPAAPDFAAAKGSPEETAPAVTDSDVVEDLPQATSQPVEFHSEDAPKETPPPPEPFATPSQREAERLRAWGIDPDSLPRALSTDTEDVDPFSAALEQAVGATDTDEPEPDTQAVTTSTAAPTASSAPVPEPVSAPPMDEEDASTVVVVELPIEDAWTALVGPSASEDTTPAVDASPELESASGQAPEHDEALASVLAAESHEETRSASPVAPPPEETPPPTVLDASNALASDTKPPDEESAPLQVSSSASASPVASGEATQHTAANAPSGNEAAAPGSTAEKPSPRESAVEHEASGADSSTSEQQPAPASETTAQVSTPSQQASATEQPPRSSEATATVSAESAQPHPQALAETESPRASEATARISTDSEPQHPQESAATESPRASESAATISAASEQPNPQASAAADSSRASEAAALISAALGQASAAPESPRSSEATAPSSTAAEQPNPQASAAPESSRSSEAVALISAALGQASAATESPRASEATAPSNAASEQPNPQASAAPEASRSSEAAALISAALGQASAAPESPRASDATAPSSTAAEQPNPQASAATETPRSTEAAASVLAASSPPPSQPSTAPQSPRTDEAAPQPSADAQSSTATARSRRRTFFDLAPAVPVTTPAAAEVVLGIDVGTSHARVAALIDGVATTIPIPGNDGSGLPSVIAVNSTGEFLVGAAALVEASRAPRRAATGLKRLLGIRTRSPNLRWLSPQLHFPIATDLHGDAGVELDGRHVAPTLLTAMLLRELHQAATTHLGRKVTRAVLCAPSHFTERQRAALREAATMAGLDVPRVLTNSAAAALAYAHGRGLARKRVLVVDLGGGGLEVCVVQVTGDDLEVVTTGGDPTLGGMDFDARIAEALVSDLAEQGHPRPEHLLDWGPLRTLAESTKETLSTQDSVDVTLPTGPGPKLDRERMEALTADLAQRVVSVTREVLESNALSPQGLDAVLLVGGQSRSPLVRRRLEESLGVPVRDDDVDARTAVVRGAALLGHALLLSETGKPAASVSEVLTAPIGVAEDAGTFRRVLERNTRLPTAKTLVIPITVPGPLALAFFQGTAATAVENEWLGCLTLTVERPGEVEVHLELSTDGTLAFSATLPGAKRQPVTLAAEELDDASRDALIARSPFHTEPEARPSGLLSGLKKLFGRR
ncbi:TIGR02266 family protein [Corallococcus sp. AB038B]|uniref:TIGR02266 family protein n=1 Tax=Corallococcus sp. AB038B TaxID=2316718 RepID=UPI001F39A9C9|nr:TIGR02266 family protein [Corallococcus sp. AB038B]